ncbi:MAG TPA: D-2-hydroxyacid dehydrogenase family protein [Burkholderiales bacterium]|jgi:phosphoglycerate dehydrogenase-like enzyme|nr:D-2-hydroxyacid dehydrogenase family protein [Burkholderiales bacterium]
MRVAVLDDYHRVFEDDPSIARLRRRVPVDVFTEKLASLDRLREYPILIALRERTRLDAAFFERLPSLELIAQTGNHAYHVDVAAATRAGVLIGMATSDVEAMGALAHSTIELTFGLMLAVMRRIPQTDQAMRRGEWPSFAGRTLAGKKLGIVGLGRIGREVAAIARAFGMEILAWGPTLTPERAARSEATFMELDALLQAADVVTVHLRLSDESRGLLDERRLRLMRPHAVLINTARGAIVEEKALTRILEDGAIAAAGLDVFVEEPLDRGSPLRRLDNVVITSHLGWPADSTYRTMAEGMVAIVDAYLDGNYERALNPEALKNRK